MIAQLIGFTICSYCFIAVGSLVKRFANWTIPYSHDFLIGLAISNAFFTLISLSYPINNTVCLLFIVSVTTLVFLNFSYEQTYFRQLSEKIVQRAKESPILFCLLAIFLFISFFQSLYSPSLHYDSGLYHVPAIKWAAEYKTIRGLANLNAFLGYNFNIFSLEAAFYNLFQYPIYPINFVATCFFSAWIIERITYATRLNQYLLCATYLLILYYLVVAFWPHISTPSTDILVFIVSSIIILSATDLKTNKETAFPIIILSVYVVTLKISAIPVLLIGLYVFFSKYLWERRKQALICFLISSLIIIPWMAKNVLLTGWILFPLPEIDLFSFDWKLSEQDVNALREDIRSFYIPAKKSSGSIIRAWFSSQIKADLLVIILFGITLTSLIFKLATRKVSLTANHTAAITVSIIGISFVCISSPSLRYGSAFFLVFIVLSVKSFNYTDSIGKYGFYLCGMILTVSFLKGNWFHPWHFSKHIATRFLLPYPLVLTEKGEFAYFLVDKKIKCYYPVASNQCFDQSLPCASKKVDGLHMRGNQIEQGFYRDAQ